MDSSLKFIFIKMEVSWTCAYRPMITWIVNIIKQKRLTATIYHKSFNGSFFVKRVRMSRRICNNAILK